MVDYEEELDRYLDEIKELARSKQYARLRDLFLPMEPADIALLLEESGGELMPLLYRLLPKELAAEVFVELESDSQEMLINGFSNTELKEVLDELYLDDAVDIVEEMPASVVIRILDKATPEMRKSINEILKYPEDSTGSIMNMEFLSLKKDMTVEDAFKRIRRIGGELETINILYVTDPTRRLLGVLSVRDLLLAEEDDLIEDIMDPNVVWVSTMDDKEDAAQALSKYGFLAMPVVDLENRLVGMKSRGVYETPGGTILYKAHEVLETLTLDKLTAHKKRELSITFGELVYDGQWFSPLRKALSAFVTSTQENVTGKVRLELYKGNMINAGVWSPYSLYREDIATFAAGGDYKQSDATGFISIYGLPTKVQAIVNNEKEGK